MYQGMHYLNYSSNFGSPDEDTVYRIMLSDQNSMIGIVLALVDQNMFKSSLDGS